MGLKKYIAIRSVHALVTLFGISILIFFLSRIMPGDPAAAALGEEAKPEQIAKLRKEMGLDQPIFVQYFIFLGNLLFKGELGLSSLTYRDALKDVSQYFAPTFELVTASMALALLAGIPLGILASQRRDKWLDHFIRLFTISGVSMPRFWTAVLLQLVVAYGLGMLPVTGRLERGVPVPTHITGLFIVDSLITGNFTAFVGSVRSLILPAITLALSPMAAICRYVRGSMLDESTKDYVFFARANGISSKLLTYRHMLRNAISPVLTQSSLTFAYLLGNAFEVEVMFSWPGQASYAQLAAVTKDVNAIVAVTLIIGIFYLVINLFVDLGYGYLDPRARVAEKA